MGTRRKMPIRAKLKAKKMRDKRARAVDARRSAKGQRKRARKNRLGSER